MAASSRKRHVAVAIDGPAASGKSTVAKAVAEKFGFTFVNSGSMYRAFTWHVLRSEVDPSDTAAVIALLEETEFKCGMKDGQSTITVNGDDPGSELKSERVNATVSTIASIPPVRARLVAEQRGYLEVTNVVMEGRDIGSVVFPDTPYKFFLSASAEERARRRAKEGIKDDIVARDQQDSRRKASPLIVAEGARSIDTSWIGKDEVVARVIQILKDMGVRPAPPEGERKHPFQFIYWIGNTLFNVSYKGLYRHQVINREKLLLPGGAMIAANHASFIDPPAVGICFPYPVHYVARQTLFKGVAAWIFRNWNGIELDQDKAQLSSMRKIVNLLKGGEKVIIFPEGQRSWDGDLQPAQRGVGMLIAKAKVPVIPVRIFGAYDIYPRDAKVPQLHGKLTVVAGDPIFFTEAELKARGKEGYQKLADRVMDEVAKIELPAGV